MDRRLYNLIYPLCLWGLLSCKSDSKKSAAPTTSEARDDEHQRPTDAGEGVSGYLDGTVLGTGEVVYSKDNAWITTPKGALGDVKTLLTIEPLTGGADFPGTVILGNPISVRSFREDLTQIVSDKTATEILVTLVVPFSSVDDLQKLAVVIESLNGNEKNMLPKDALDIIDNEDSTLTISFLTKTLNGNFSAVLVEDQIQALESINITSVPKNPQELTVTAERSEVTLTWDVVDSADSYLLTWVFGLKSPANCYTGDVLGFLSIDNAKSTTISGLNEGTIYTFRLCARNGDGISNGNAASVSTKGAYGVNAPHSLKVFQHNLPKSAIAGQNILTDGLFKVELQNEQGARVPGSGAIKAHLVPHLDPACSEKATGGIGGSTNLLLASGEALFWNYNYQQSEEIYLAICDSADCRSGELPVQKTCIQSKVEITASVPARIAIADIDDQLTGNVPFNLSVAVFDQYDNWAQEDGQVTVNVCTGDSSGTGSCKQPFGKMNGTLQQSLTNGNTNFSDLTYTAGGLIKLQISTENFSILSEALLIKPPSDLPFIQADSTASTSTAYKTIGLDVEGRAYCFGTGYLGNGNTVATGQPGSSENGLITLSNLDQNDAQFQKVDVGKYGGCGLTFKGKVYCWGKISYLIGASQSLIPKAINDTYIANEDRVFMDIAVGKTHACAISDTGAAYCWGSSDSARFEMLGLGGNIEKLDPEKVDVSQLTGNDSLFIDVDAGTEVTCFRSVSENLYCVGDTNFGQTGNGTLTIIPGRPELKVSGNQKWQKVSAGHRHVCAIDEKRQAFCWGAGGRHRLGNGDTSNANEPVMVNLNFLEEADREIRDISAGAEHTCLITFTNKSYCFGNGGSYRLGFDDTVQAQSDLPYPKKDLPVGTYNLGPSEYFSMISAGENYSCGISTSGQVYCWGGNSSALGGGSLSQYYKIPIAAAGESLWQ